MRFTGLHVAVVPFPALGDLTIYLRLAQAFSEAGAKVVYLSDHLAPAAARFDWLQVVPFAGAEARRLLADFDLVVWDVGVSPAVGEGDKAAALAKLAHEYAHLALVTSKDLPGGLEQINLPLVVAGCELGPRCATFCRDTKAGPTMVDWVDRYAHECFGLEVPEASPRLAKALDSARATKKAVIFPTTPNPKKNYWPRGFRKLARELAGSGWEVSFVVVPAELSRLEAEYQPFPVRAFSDLAGLIDYLRDACIVISNDSGGGHLASMMGLHTVTITRKPPDFVWRPGFNRANHVLSPLLTFKLGGGHVWRPFVPYWRIPVLAQAAWQTKVGAKTGASPRTAAGGHLV